MKKDLLERLEEYCGADYVPLHMPGAKRNTQDRKSTRLNSSHANESRMPSSA